MSVNIIISTQNSLWIEFIYPYKATCMCYITIRQNHSNMNNLTFFIGEECQISCFCMFDFFDYDSLFRLQRSISSQRATKQFEQTLGLGKKPEFIYGNRISGNEGEKGVIEYAVIYQEDEELKYEIRRDQVIKTEGQMYILNW